MEGGRGGERETADDVTLERGPLRTLPHHHVVWCINRRTGHAVKNRFHQMSNGIKRRRWGQISAGPSSPTSSSAAVSSSTAQGMPTTDVSKAWGKSQAYSTGANGGPLLSHHHHPHDQPHHHHHRHHHMSQQPMMGMDHQMAAHHHHLQQQQDAAYSEHMLRAEQQGPPSGQHYHHLQLQAPSQHHLHPSQHMHATHQQLLEVSTPPPPTSLSHPCLRTHLTLPSSPSLWPHSSTSTSRSSTLGRTVTTARRPTSTRHTPPPTRA